MKNRTPLGWGPRFKAALFSKGKTLRDVAEKLGRAESSVRSWTNGTRLINLNEFLELCAAAGIDPAYTLFDGSADSKFLEIGRAWEQATPMEKEVLRTAAQGILLKRGDGRASDTSTAVPSVGRRGSARSRL